MPQILAVSTNKISTDVLPRNKKLWNKKTLNKAKQVLPIVTVPLVAYNINKTKLIKESDQSYQPYTKALEQSQKEFSDRHLVWNDSYANTNTGYLNPAGKNIIKNFDENELKFKNAGLNFDNSLINSSTGELSPKGYSVWDNYKDAVKKLDDANIAPRTQFFDKRTGKLTDYSQKQLGFKGLPEDAPSYPSATLSDAESGYAETPDNIPQIEDIPELPGIEVTETIPEADSVESLLNNPLAEVTLLAVGAELIPLTRFLQPCKDFLNGDFSKAGIGAVSRGIDMFLSLFKLAGGLGCATAGGLRRIIDNDKDFGFIKGFTEFYSEWANKRDDIENIILDRPTKDEIKKQNREKRELILKQQKEREEQIKAKQAQLKKEKEEREEKLRQEEKRINTIKKEIIQEKELETLGDGNKWLGYERRECKLLVDKLKALKPDKNITKYDNYRYWSRERLEKNRKILLADIYKAQKKQKSQTSENDTYQIELKNLRSEFLLLLEKYKFYKPNANLSNFSNWQNWGFSQLMKNTNLLVRYLEKAKAQVT